MKRLVAAVVVLAAMLLSYLAGARAQENHPRQLWVSKRYGTFKGVYNDQLLFEDDSGTIRSVYPNGGMVVFVVNRR